MSSLANARPGINPLFFSQNMEQNEPEKNIPSTAAKAISVADIPAADSRGVEKFFDGKSFDPANPKAYLDSLAIKTAA